MTGLVSVDRDDDYVVQLKTQRQKTHCKNNQLSDCASINPNVNSVINGKRALFYRVRTAATCCLVSPCLLKHRSKSPGRRRDVARKFWASVIPEAVT